MVILKSPWDGLDVHYSLLLAIVGRLFVFVPPCAVIHIVFSSRCLTYRLLKGAFSFVQMLIGLLTGRFFVMRFFMFFSFRLKFVTPF